MSKQSQLISILGCALALLSGCDGDTVYVGNLAVTAVPCVLMYMTLNLKKER